MNSNDVIVPQPLYLAVKAITPLVLSYFDMPDKAKLSVRMGHADQSTGNWVKGVSKETFDEIVDMFLRYKGWDTMCPEWQDIHDYMYSVDNSSVHTAVHLNTSLQLTHFTQNQVAMVELDMRTHGRARVFLTNQTPVCAKTLPDTVTPHMVRIQKQRSFHRGPWRFSVTRVWHGDSRTLAEEAQSRDECSYEVEVEFVPDPEYWYDAKHTCTYVATSLLMKVVDVVSDEMIGCEVISPFSTHKTN